MPEWGSLQIVKNAQSLTQLYQPNNKSIEQDILRWLNFDNNMIYWLHQFKANQNPSLNSLSD